MLGFAAIPLGTFAQIFGIRHDAQQTIAQLIPLLSQRSNNAFGAGINIFANAFGKVDIFLRRVNIIKELLFLWLCHLSPLMHDQRLISQPTVPCNPQSARSDRN